MLEYADIIVDLQAGDTGKGKVAHALSRKPGEYTHVIRYNGGGNAGHTVYHEGKKIVTHFIPVGVLYGIKSIIGPGCVINPHKLEEEINELKSHGISVKDKLFIDKRVHLITQNNIMEDSQDTSIGTTKTGNGPAYKNKYGRTGTRAESYTPLSDMIIDIYEELHQYKKLNRVLFEGAQGFELDIDWGDYPYVTSSHCTVGGAILNGIPPQKIRSIIGVAKAYRTYVGAKKFSEDSEIFEKITELGYEYGATTGRKRQVNWLEIEGLVKAANINGVTELIINKMDILEKAGELKLLNRGNVMEFDNTNKFQRYITDVLKYNCPLLQTIKFSVTPFDI